MKEYKNQNLDTNIQSERRINLNNDATTECNKINTEILSIFLSYNNYLTTNIMLQ